jgi:hypothetical protein
LASFSFQDQAVSPPSLSFIVDDLTAEEGDEASSGQALSEENQAKLKEILSLLQRGVTEPPKIVLYYRLSLSTWPLSNNKELLCRFRRVKPGKSHTTGLLICAKPTRMRDQSTILHYIITNQVFRT